MDTKNRKFDPKKRAYNWLFTIYNLDCEELIKNMDKEKVGFRYIIFQREACPTTGKLHLQGYLELDNAKTCSAIQKIVEDKCHLQPADGSRKSNQIYCTKSESAIADTVYEWGGQKKQGTRNDLNEVAEFIKGGARIREVAREHPTMVIKYHNNLKALISYLHEPSDDVVKCYFLWGKPGVGKTSAVFNEFGKRNVARGSIAVNGQWWFDEYTGDEDCILLDDVTPDMFTPGGVLLQYLDRYPVKLPQKGGFVWRACTHIVVTSNWDPVGLKPEYVRRFVDIAEIKADTPAYTFT